MGFPFLAPLSPWVTEVMKDREKNLVKTSALKNPYVILTSGALVIQGSNIANANDKDRRDEIKKLVNPKTRPTTNVYKGCIISNNSNILDYSYSTGKTIVGVDFTGKPIMVEGEEARKISTPIIETLDIDTDGANNTLKTARLSIKCFSLKQLEMFELFFMKPGMNVLVEYGDSTILSNTLNPRDANNTSPQNRRRSINVMRNGAKQEIDVFKNIGQALVEKTDYDTFCNKFSEYYRSDTDAIGNYLQRVEQSLGSYDLVAGKVLDYSFSIDGDGTYSVSLEVSAGNQVSLAIPHNTKKGKGNEKTQVLDKEFPDYAQILELIISDLNLDSKAFKRFIGERPPQVPNAINWENDFFNFIKINKEQKDTVASDKSYISLRFILDILLNYSLAAGNVDTDFFKLELPTYNVGGKKIKAIPVTSSKNIISSTEDVIFPSGNLPKPIAPPNPDKKKPLPPEENFVRFDLKNGIDGKINGYDFHTTEKFEYFIKSKDGQIIGDSVKIEPLLESDVIGNALNIFLKYELVAKAWNSTYTRIDFLDKILSMVNDNSYGLFKLVYGLQNENSAPTIIDYKLVNKVPEVKDENSQEIYRFKPTTINSIVKQFSFNFEMSNLVAGRTIFNSGKILSEAKAESKQTDDNTDYDKLELPASAYKSVDNSTFGNADNWYSINNVELKRLEESFQKAVEKEKNAKITTDPEKPKDVTNQAEDFSQLIANKSVSFLDKKNPKTNRTLIYKDSKLIQNAITGESNIETQKTGKKKPTLSPIDVTIQIDGFSGFRCGEYFNIDGIPEIYNQIGVFQITNTKHNVGNDGWTTTIEAGHRILNKK